MKMTDFHLFEKSALYIEIWLYHYLLNPIALTGVLNKSNVKNFIRGLTAICHVECNLAVLPFSYSYKIILDFNVLCSFVKQGVLGLVDNGHATTMQPSRVICI